MAVADLVCGDVVADIGSDHGYLPIWLYLNGRIKRAYALDMSEKCVERCRLNLRKYNISEDIITPVVSNGLDWLTANGVMPQITDITVAGLGSKSISEIIKDARGVNLALQTNCKAGVLREFLLENGFCILRETTAECKKRTYTVINAKK